MYQILMSCNITKCFFGGDEIITPPFSVFQSLFMHCKLSRGRCRYIICSIAHTLSLYDCDNDGGIICDKYSNLR